MRTVGLFVLAMTTSFGVAQGQVPATYSERAVFAEDATFKGRVLVATLVSAVAVLAEPQSTTDNAVRVRFAGYVLRDPDRVGGIVAKVLAANVDVQVAEGVTRTTLTDEQLQTFILQRWTPLARALMAGYSNVP